MRLYDGLRKSVLFRNQTLRSLWLAQSVSTLGDQVFRVTLMWTAYQLGGAGMLGTIFLYQTTAVLLIVLFGGVIANRVRPRKLLIIADVMRAASVLLVGFLLFYGKSNTAWLSVLGVVFGIGEALFRPSYSLLFKLDVDDESYGEGMALVSSSRQLFNFLGPVIGSVIVSQFNFAYAFWIDGLSFVLSALFILMVKSRSSVVLAETAVAAKSRDFNLKQEVAKIFKEIGAGFNYVWKVRWLRFGILLTTIAIPVQQGMSTVGLPTYVFSLTDSAASYSSILASYAVGAFVGSSIFVFLRKRKNTPQQAFMLLMLSNLIYGICGWSGNIYMMVGFSFFIGMLMQAYNITWETCVLGGVDSSKIANVYSVAMFGYTGMTPFGVMILTSIIGVIGVKSTVIYAPWFVAAVAFIMMLSLGKLKNNRNQGVNIQ